MHFQCRSFIGRTSDTSWSQFWENEPDELSTVSTRGHLFGLISLTSSTLPTPLTQLGHDLIESITSNYFTSEFTNISDNLKNTLSNLTLPQDTRSTIAVAVVHRDTLYLALSGSGTVHLLRQGKIANIIENYSHDVKVVSGPLKDSDSIIITSNDFIKLITWDALKSALDSDKLQAIEENLLSLLYSSSADAESSAVLIQVYQDQDTPEQIGSEISSNNLVTEDPELPAAISPPVTTPTIFAPRRPHRSLLSSLQKILRPPQTDIVVNPVTLSAVSRRHRFNLIAAIILLIGLSFSVYLGYQRRLQNQKQDQFDTLKTELESKLSNASTVRSLNLQTAQDLAVASQALLGQMKAIGISTVDLSSYETQINDLLSQTGSPGVEVAKPFFELNLITDNPSYSQISIFDNNLYLLDSSKSRLDVLNILQKSHENYATDPILSDISGLAPTQNGIYTLTSSSLYLITSKDRNSKFDLSSLSDSSKIKDFGLWNGAIYLLDSAKGTIWKLTPNSSGFSHADWLASDQEISDTVNSLAINGKIWTLSSDAKITPYLRGAPDSFKQPQDISTTSAKGLITTAQGDYLAFFDDSNIVYVYNKDGSSKSRFNLNDKKILDIAFSADSNRIFVLCQDQKLYTLSL